VKVGDNANREVKLQDNTPQDAETALPLAYGTLLTAPMAPVRKRSAVATGTWMGIVLNHQLSRRRNCHFEC
jgi:hypothetical protein